MTRQISCQNVFFHLIQIYRHLSFKHLPHRSPKVHSKFKGAIVLKEDEAAVLSESGEIGLINLSDKEATLKR